MQTLGDLIPIIASDQFVYLYSAGAFLSFLFSFTPVLTYGTTSFYMPNRFSLVWGALGFAALLGFFLQVFFILLNFQTTPYLKETLSFLPCLSVAAVIAFRLLKDPSPVGQVAAPNARNREAFALGMQKQIVFSKLEVFLEYYQSLIYQDTTGKLHTGNACEVFDFLLQRKIRRALRDLTIPEPYQDPAVFNHLTFDLCYGKAQEVFLPLKSIKSLKEWEKAVGTVLEIFVKETTLLESSVIGVESFPSAFRSRTRAAQQRDSLILQEKANAIQDRLQQTGIHRIQTGKEFEIFCQRYLKILGWSASLTKTTGDFGADVVAQKKGKKVIIQCKYYKKSVGLDAVQEIYSAISLYKADYGAVIGRSGYTKGAKRLAEANQIVLLHVDDLFKLDTIFDV